MKTLIHLTAVVFIVFTACPLEAGPKSRGHRGHGRRGHHHRRHHHHRHHRGHYGYGPRVGFDVVPFETGTFYDPLVGEAEVIRAFGEYNRDTSEALINIEQARQHAIENHQQYVETRNELKRQWRERMLARNRRRQRPQPEGKVSVEKQVERLSPEEFNRATGEIAWPEVLLDPQFNEYRAAFEAIFTNPAPQKSGAGTNLHRDVNEVAAYMKAQLRLQVGLMAPSDYMAAKKFIVKLANEASHVEMKPQPNSALTLLK